MATSLSALWTSRASTNADVAHAVQIAHDEQLPTGSASYLQCALLYTNAEVATNGYYL